MLENHICRRGSRGFTIIHKFSLQPHRSLSESTYWRYWLWQATTSKPCRLHLCHDLRISFFPFFSFPSLCPLRNYSGALILLTEAWSVWIRRVSTITTVSLRRTSIFTELQSEVVKNQINDVPGSSSQSSKLFSPQQPLSWPSSSCRFRAFWMISIQESGWLFQNFVVFSIPF